MKKEMKKEIMQTAGVVVFDKENRVLLVEHLEEASHITGVFGLPAGRIEEGESSPNTAIRELEEETGLIANLEDIVFVKQYVAEIERKGGIKTISLDVYLCTKFKGCLQSSKETKCQWMKPDELKKVENILPNVKEAISKAREMN